MDSSFILWRLYSTAAGEHRPGYNRGGGIIFCVLIMSVLLVFHSGPLFPQTTCGVTNKVGEAQQLLNNGLMSMKMMWIICDGLLSHHVAPLVDFVTITERSTPPSFKHLLREILLE